MTLYTGTNDSANSVDPDQTAPRGAFWSGSTLFAIQQTALDMMFASFKYKDPQFHCSNWLCSPNI